MKLIPLTRGLFAKVDDADFEWLSQFKWHTDLKPHTCYAQRSVKRTENGKKVRYGMRMHVAILGKREGFEIDHINNDGLDNRRENLRFCTRSQNNMNRKPQRLGRRGVTYDASKKKWAAQIQIDRQNILIGRFTNPEDAAHAYDATARELFGQFAKLNFPEAA